MVEKLYNRHKRNFQNAFLSTLQMLSTTYGLTKGSCMTKIMSSFYSPMSK